MKAAWQPTLKFIRLLDASAATVALRFEFPLFTFFERGFSLLFLRRNIVRVCKICCHFSFFPAVATGLNKVVSDLIKSIRCCLIESGGGVGGEVGDSFTRKKKKTAIPGEAGQQKGLIYVVKCSGTACCYYPSGCYCTKPRTDNEMMYGLLRSRQGMCVFANMCMCVLNEEPGGTICLTDSGYKRWWDCVREENPLCLPCLPPRPTCKRAHLSENTHARSSLSAFSSLIGCGRRRWEAHEEAIC